MFGLCIPRIRLALVLSAIGFALPSSQSFGSDLVGMVRDSEGKPIPNARIRVFASRPINSNPVIVTILHPDCQLTSEADEQGRFNIKGITDGHQVMLVVWKKGYLISRTEYVSPPTENLMVAIRADTEIKLSGRITGKITDANDRPIANAVVGYDNAYISTKPIAVLTDTYGNFSLPSEDRAFPVALTAVIPQIGLRELRILSSTFAPQDSWTILPSVTVKGRIIDAKGPVPNYNVCVSTASSYGPRSLLLTVATDSEGLFAIQGVPEGPDGLGRELEYCLFGDITQANSRGHLATKRFDAGNNGEVLDFGDMRLGPVTNLTLKLQLNGARLESNRNRVIVSLRQESKAIYAPIDENGLAKLENLPCEPLRFRLEWQGPFRYSDSNKYQRDYGDGFYFTPNSHSELAVQMDRVR